MSYRMNCNTNFVIEGTLHIISSHTLCGITRLSILDVFAISILYQTKSNYKRQRKSLPRLIHTMYVSVCSELNDPFNQLFLASGCFILIFDALTPRPFTSDTKKISMSYHDNSKCADISSQKCHLILCSVAFLLEDSHCKYTRHQSLQYVGKLYVCKCSHVCHEPML